MDLGPGFMEGMQLSRNVLEPTLLNFVCLFLVLRDFYGSVTCIQKRAQILNVLLAEFPKTEYTHGTSLPTRALLMSLLVSDPPK